MTQLKPIRIVGARTNNLKNVTVTIPRNSLVVVTGVSGSGKSSLVFDTLYAEGHRRYVESLSSYTRQFIARMQKPDVDKIEGVSPAIAIEQRVGSTNSRSTVGSITEIYDFLRLLFARVGKTYSPVTGLVVKPQNVGDVVDYINNLTTGDKVYITTLLPQTDRTIDKELEISIQKGFTRLWIQNKVVQIEDCLSNPMVIQELTWENMYLLIDRFVIENLDDDFNHRIADSIQTAFNEGNSKCEIIINENKTILFSEAFEADGISFEIPTPHLFNYNNAVGACPACEGSGKAEGFDPDLIFQSKHYSVLQGVVECWKGKTKQYLEKFINQAAKINFPVQSPYYSLSNAEKDILWYGYKPKDNPEIYIEGILDFFDSIPNELNKMDARIMIAKYRGMSICNNCNGTRLKPSALYVKVNNYTISELLSLSIQELYHVFTGFVFDDRDQKIANRIITEISNRLLYLKQVGLGYLNMNRKASTLSGGETQRINLATSLGSNLTGSLYILDEPSIGLHPKDTDNLIGVLENLRNLGNTVVVVEHDETIMKHANYLIDVGPAAGELGGEIIFSGDYNSLLADTNSLTGKYLANKIPSLVSNIVEEPTKYITINTAAENNLKGITVKIPLERLSVVTGVSGSGKTTLIKSILYPALCLQYTEIYPEKPGIFEGLAGNIGDLTSVEFVSQNALTRNVRSTPLTLLGISEFIRNEFANTRESKASKYTAMHFSNHSYLGGCDACDGEGEITIPMQFLPDVKMTCEVCNGLRFKSHVLDVKIRDKNIADVLKMTVNEAVQFFENNIKIKAKLTPLVQVGLGYIRIGDNVTGLSGGEAQRLKLASFLAEQQNENTSSGTSRKTMYIFDEPTTGLHFDDVKRLIEVFRYLIQKGHSVLVIEHNLDVIKSADYIIDLGPEGGDAGGYLVYQGPTKGILDVKESYTAQYLREKF